MKLYNTLTRSKDTFAPGGPVVTIYVCGITPYDTTHLGHAFTYCAADVLRRYLEFTGRPVHYTQNVTDIDDDILKRARETGEDWRALGNRWTSHFIRDMTVLNVLPPNDYPRATDVIPDIVAAVRRLVDLGLGYVSGNSVYFDLRAWPEFGHLSRLPHDQMLPLANERGNIPDDPNKRHPLDFVLWQAQAPGEPAWESPWGPGRPGWHIECSTMAARFLSTPVDIHGGGEDLIFPHHEAEIAQAEPVTGARPFARFWFHTAMVRHAGEKMSKSLGNLIMVDDLLRECAPNAVRLYLAAHHYREPWSHDDAELARATTLAQKLDSAALSPEGRRRTLDSVGEMAEFAAAMDDDLNTPAAFTVLERLADSVLSASRKGGRLAEAKASLQAMGRILGLRLNLSGPEPRVTEGWLAAERRSADRERTSA